MIDSLANILASEVFTPEEVTHPAMGMSHTQMVSHAYGHHAASNRKWIELTNKEIMDLATIMSGMPLYLALIEKFKEKNT